MISIERVDYSNPRHARDLIFLLNHYASSVEGGGRPLTDFVQKNLLDALKRCTGAQSLLAYDGDKAVALLNAFEGFSTFKCQPLFNIHDLVVLEPYRNQGVAQQMLSATETIARERGYCKLTLEVLEANLAAQRAYSKFGFCSYELNPKMGKALFWEKALDL